VTNSNFESNSNSVSESNSASNSRAELHSNSNSSTSSASGSRPQADAKVNSLSEEIGVKAALKLKAQRSGTPGVWFGLGMTGLIGWSVVVPTLLGTAFGVWLDSKYPGLHSWTLMGLAVGILVGCLSAWHWVQSEDKAMHGDGSASADGTRGPRP
jgi:ATP synthase protein I